MASGDRAEFIKYGDPLKGMEKGRIKAVSKLAGAIVANARPLAPVDTGLLRNAIHYRLTSGKTYGYLEDPSLPIANEERNIKPRRVRPPKGKGEAHVGFNLFYGVYQEFGYRTLKNGTYVHIDPQAFLRPAVNIVIHKRSIQEAVARSFMFSFEESVTKGRKKIEIIKV